MMDKKIYKFHWPRRCRWEEISPVQAVNVWKEIDGKKVDFGKKMGTLYRCELCGCLREEMV